MSLTFLALMLAQAVPLAAPVVPDTELAEQRGGFQLPSGIDVALTVQTQTSLNGAVVLRTEYRADTGTPGFTVYAPRPGEVVAAPASSGAAQTPTVTYDSRSGIQVTQNGVPNVSIGDITQNVAEGLQQVTDGTALATDSGVVSRVGVGGLQGAELRAADLTITHLAGTAFGSAIANSGNDRAIDTQTALTINLSNAGPDVLGSAMLRIEGVALDAVRWRQ